MINLSDAYSAAIAIPALKAVYDPSDRAFLESTLEQYSGLKAGVRFYRIWIAAATYLELSPAIHRVVKHDKTTLGDYSKPVSFLKSMQITQDIFEDLVVPDNLEKTPVPSYSVAIAPPVRFYG